jgi:small nuclear ribonucleoprotein G
MVAVPELKQYIDKEIKVELNGNRVVQGKLVGYDFFLNLTLNQCVEVKADRGDIEYVDLGQCVIRGNSVINIEFI